ncbi:MAG: DUF721 domain-containing protein [Pirellulales bacterium]
MKQGQGPRPIGDLLNELFARRGYGRQQANQSYGKAWSEAAGVSLAGKTRVGKVQGGTFEVIAASSTLVQEMTFQKQTLLAQLIERLPDEKITKLKFRVGNVR